MKAIRDDTSLSEEQRKSKMKPIHESFHDQMSAVLTPEQQAKTVFAFDPISRMVPTTITRMTASMTAHSAISWPFFDFRIARYPGVSAIDLHKPT
jgi:hypothetical protein